MLIKYRNRMSQVNNFDGLQFGSITPTDIDAFLDFGNKFFIIIESKYQDAELPFGQKLALERLTDACHAGGIPTYLLIGSHNYENGKDVDFKNIRINKCRFSGKWTDINNIILHEAVERIREKHL